nr:GNAT family N-acetyltransferase [Bacilli bacterium]
YYFGDDFYSSIKNDLKDNAKIFYAELNEKIIACSIIIFANGKVNYHLSGSLREFQSLAPSNLMLWKVAQWGNENGFKTFHLGGGVGCKDDSLFKFKRAFYKGDLCKYRIGKKIFNKEAYDLLVAKSNKQDDLTGFFPLYRR